MKKLQTTAAVEEFFRSAIDKEAQNFSPSELRLLASGLSAVCAAYEKTLNKIERYAIKSMVAYVAARQAAHEETVSALVADRFGLRDLESMPSRLYQPAIEYLVDLRIENIVN